MSVDFIRIIIFIIAANSGSKKNNGDTATHHSYGWRDNPNSRGTDDHKRGSSTYDRSWSSGNWHDGHARGRNLCGRKDVAVICTT